jgi:hypothetical protein
MKITESPGKKRKLGPGNDGDGGEREKKDGKSCPCPSKFAAIKRDLKSMIGDKRNPYNTLFIRFGFLERWADKTIM